MLARPLHTLIDMHSLVGPAGDGRRMTSPTSAPGAARREAASSVVTFRKWGCAMGRLTRAAFLRVGAAAAARSAGVMGM